MAGPYDFVNLETEVVVVGLDHPHRKEGDEGPHHGDPSNDFAHHQNV